MSRNKTKIPLGFFLIVLSICIFAKPCNSLVPDSIDNLKKISTVNLLMPIIFENLDSRSIQFLLRGYNGCYEWSSSQPNVLSVEGIQENGRPCDSQAVVSLRTNNIYNNIIWITARDKGIFITRNSFTTRNWRLIKM